jgi:hypothetical protein
LVPANSGKVVMELGGTVQRQQIGPNGTADFKDVPPSHRGKAVPLWFESDQFESVHPEQRYVLKGDDTQMEVRRKAGKLSGRVQDENGNPVGGAKIEVAGISTTTDPWGHFELPIPGDHLRPQMDVEIAAADFESGHYTVVPNSEHVVLTLKKSH